VSEFRTSESPQCRQQAGTGDEAGEPAPPYSPGAMRLCVLGPYVDDVDAVCAKAEAAGATVKSPPKDQFYGDRSCHIEDPFGHMWTLATHVKDVSEEDMAARAAEAAASD